jgi:hypothetical protein
MKKEWILIMKRKKRLKLKILQTLTHFGIVLFLLFIVSLSAWSLFQIYITDTYTGVRSANELIKSSLPFLALALLFAFIQNRRLRLREFKVAFTDDQFQEAIERTVKDLEWRVDRNNKTFFRAYRPWNWTGSWGEMVTIIKDKDRLLVNSICDPDRMTSVASYGWNKKNINTFLTYLTDVINDKPIEIKIEKEINEWSRKRFLIRLLAYPFCVFLILFGIYMVLQPMTIRTTLAGVGAISIASIYLYFDIKIMKAKFDRKRKPNR